MKKGLFFSSALMAVLAMSSCSEEADFALETTQDGTKQVIEIAVENGGDGLTTRGGRPLFSSEAKQDIDNVSVVICDQSDKVVAKFTVNDWLNVSEEYNDASGHGRKIRFTLADKSNSATSSVTSSIKELEKGVTYNVYAFGYTKDDNSQYTTSDDTDLGVYFSSLTEGSSTFTKDFTIKNTEAAAGGNELTAQHNAEEIFAGSTTIEVDENGNFSKGVTLHRQVAGIFTYAYKIPYFKSAKYLNLYAVKEEPQLVLGNFYKYILADNGTQTVDPEGNNATPDNKLMNVVNGTGSTTNNKTLVNQIDLSNWFTKIQDVNNDGIIDTYGFKKSADGTTLEEDKTTADSLFWKNPYASKNVRFVKGSVFGGEFIIPFQAVSGSQTFVLELTDGSKVLRTWNINLPSYDVLKDASLWTWNIDWSEATSVTESANSYSALRNHLYGIGTKAVENPGEDPEEPEDGKEDPEDLATKQDIMLQVNDNWELIHEMVVD